MDLEPAISALLEAHDRPLALPDLELTSIQDKVETAASIVEAPGCTIPRLASAIRTIIFAEECAEEVGMRGRWQRVVWLFGRDEDPRDVLPNLSARQHVEIIRDILAFREAVGGRRYRKLAKVG